MRCPLQRICCRESGTTTGKTSAILTRDEFTTAERFNVPQRRRSCRC
jgi:hypothetical protein